MGVRSLSDSGCNWQQKVVERCDSARSEGGRDHANVLHVVPRSAVLDGEQSDNDIRQ